MHFRWQPFRGLMIVILTLQLIACGFHLRHHDWALAESYPTIILPETGSPVFYQYLYRELSSRGVHIERDPCVADLPSLRVISETLTSQPLVYGADGELRRERLKMTITFTFKTHHEQQFALYTERERQLNNRQHLGDNAEKTILESEMRLDIIQQLFRYLATQSR